MPRLAGPPGAPVQRAPRAGERLAARYRLDAPLSGPTGSGAVLWRAVDEVLGRPVAVRVLPARTRDGAARPFLAAAARTGPVLAAGVARTLDATVEERPGRTGEPRVVAAYVVSEWVDGHPLAEVLAAGAVPPCQAVRLVGEAADALAAVHAAGLAHGRVTARTLLLGADGRARLTGAATAALAHGEPAPTGQAGVRADARALAEVLYALLTGHWPGAPGRAGGLPLAPGAPERPVPPRRLARRVPRPLAAVVQSALQVPPDSPQQLATRARAALGTGGPARARRGAGLRRAAPWAAATAVLVAAGTGGYRLGVAVGALEPPGDPLAGIARAASGPVAERTLVDLRAPGVRVRDHDPDGDGREAPREVARAVDGDPATAWRTDRYRTADLGGLKPGVGLLVDLGRSTELLRAEVDAAAGGAWYELRAGERPDRLRRVSGVERAGARARLPAPPGVRARYWLLWVTRLPGEAGSHRLAVEELRLVRR